MAVTTDQFNRLADRVNNEAEKRNNLQSNIATIKTELRWIKLLMIGVFIEGGVLIFQVALK